MPSDDSSSSLSKKLLYVVGGGVVLVGAGYLVKRLFFFNNSGGGDKPSSSEKEGQTATTPFAANSKPAPAQKPVIFAPEAPPKQTHCNNAENIQKQSKPDLEKRIGDLRVEGNTFFGGGRYDHAVQCYQQCVDLATYCDTEAAYKHMAPAMANAVGCFLAQSRFQAAEYAATSLIETSAFDYADQGLRVKVYFRRAKARVNVTPVADFDGALKDLEAARTESEGDNTPVMDKMREDISALEKECLVQKRKREDQQQQQQQK